MAKRFSLSLSGKQSAQAQVLPPRNGIYYCSVRKPQGMQNVGNTCYANSVLQCMINCKTLMSTVRELKDQECSRCISGKNRMYTFSNVIAVSDIFIIQGKSVQLSSSIIFNQLAWNRRRFV